MPDVTTVLFDLGGVVCRFLQERRLAALAAASGLTEQEIYRRVWESGFDRECDEGAYCEAGVYRHVSDMLGLRCTYEEFRAMWALAWEPDPVVLRVAGEVRASARVGLLTDNGPVLLDALPVHFPELVAAFDPILFSCDVGALKPNPALFAAALKKLGDPPERVLLIDDSLRNVEGAQAFGLNGLHYRTELELRRGLAPLGLIE